MTRAIRLVRRNALAYRHKWYASVFLSFLQPTLYLAAMGLGLGRLVDAGGTRVSARNPYWDRWGITIADPDGYRLVLSSLSWP